jgi:tripartite-type tricarboxylate transporter receptor subunit TctC
LILTTKESSGAALSDQRSSRLPQICCVLCISAGIYANPAAAQTSYPSKPVRWVVPFAPGGGVDVVARAVAQKLSTATGQPVVVDNRSGAAGAIGAELVANSPPDGYTLLSISTTLAVNQGIHPKLPYDLTRDFAPLTQLTSQPYFWTVHVSVPARTISELIELAKAKPNTINYASSGTGGLQHLAGELLSSMAGIKMVHVPYKGGGAAHNDLVAGHIQTEVTLPLTTSQYVKSGRLRYLAVTSPARLQAFPDVPTVAETLPGYDVLSWYGVVAPAKTPAAIVGPLSKQIMEIINLPDVGGRFAVDGTEPYAKGPQAFSTRITQDIAKWRDTARKSGIKIE